MAVPRDTVPAGVFTRASSGLVRQVSSVDTLYYCVIQIAIPYVFFILAFWSLYPGASMELATGLTFVGAAAVGLVYALYSAVYPRSGGEYVFLSRTVHPLVGFMGSFSMAVWQTWYFMANGVFLAVYALAPMCAALGLQLQSQAFTDAAVFFGDDLGKFVAGGSTVLFFAFLMHRGMKAYFTVQRWAIALALISLGITVLILAAGAAGALDFQANFDALVGPGAYDGVIVSATAAGAELPSTISLPATLAFIIWPAFSLLFAVLSTSFSGEIRNVKRGQLLGIVGGMALSAVLLVLLEYFSRLAVGDDFLRAASYLSLSAPDELPVPNGYISLLASVLANNPLLTVVINLWFVILTPLVAGTTIVYASRALFAWSIDGMAPKTWSTVSERYHSPTRAIAVPMVVALLALLPYAFTDEYTALAGLTGMGIVFLVVSIAGIAFPYRHRDVYERSAARIEVFGIPLISIAGVVASLFMAYVVYLGFTDSTFGANTPLSIRTVVAVYIIGAVWFYAARWLRRREGADLDRRFREIPVE